MHVNVRDTERIRVCIDQGSLKKQNRMCVQRGEDSFSVVSEARPDSAGWRAGWTPREEPTCSSSPQASAAGLSLAPAKGKTVVCSIQASG